MRNGKEETFVGATSITLFFSATTQNSTTDKITPNQRGIAELLVEAPVQITRRVVVSESGSIADDQSYNWEYIVGKLKTNCGLDWIIVPTATAIGMEIIFSSRGVPAVSSAGGSQGGIKKIVNPLSEIEFFDASSSAIDVTSLLDEIVETICSRYGTGVSTATVDTDFSAGSLRRSQGSEQNILPL